MAKTLMLIVNPRAGRSRSLAPLLNAISLFSEADYLVSLRQTTAQGDATRFVRENGVVYRVGQVWREAVDPRTGVRVERTLLRENHARVMYDTAGLEV